MRNNSGFVFGGEAHPSLPRLLKEQGYATGAAVSTYVLRRETGLGALFDFYEDSVPRTPGVATVRYQRPGDKTVALREGVDRRARRRAVLLLLPHLRAAPPVRARRAVPSRVRRDVRRPRSRRPTRSSGTFLDDLAALGVYDRGDRHRDVGPRRGARRPRRGAALAPALPRGDPGPAPRQAAGEPRRRDAAWRRRSSSPTSSPPSPRSLGLPTPAGVSGASLSRPERRVPRPRTIYGETLYPRLHLGWADLQERPRRPLPLHPRPAPRALRPRRRPGREERPREAGAGDGGEPGERARSASRRGTRSRRRRTRRR